MDTKIIKQQRGYLLIIAVILIVIVASIAVLLANMYTVIVRSNTNILQSDQALYIAKAGLEIARRDLLKSGSTLQCADINSSNSKYTNACYPPKATKCSGYFTVAGVANEQSKTLATAITDITSTTVNLSSTSGLLSSGVVVIENEAIWYSGISGTQLQNVARGALGTTASTHTIVGTNVFQNTCTLTSTAGVPSLSAPTDTGGQRVAQDILWKTQTNGGGLGTLPNNWTPGLVSAGTISLTGTSYVYNPSVNKNDPKFTGSTIVGGADVVFNQYSFTKVGDNQIASQPRSLSADISQNNSNINTSTLWGYFFTQSKAAMQNNATVTKIDNCATYNYASASGTVWFNCTTGSFNPNNVTMGTVNNPVVLIVNNNINMTGNVTINGLLYVINGLASSGTTTINGLVVAEGAVNLNNATGILFNTTVLTNLGLLKTNYSSYYMPQEVFH